MKINKTVWPLNHTSVVTFKILLVLSLLFTFNSCENEIPVLELVAFEGVVVEAGSATPISGATATILNQSDIEPVLTGQGGFFSFADLRIEDNTYQIQMVHPDYNSQTIEFTIEGGKLANDLTVELVPSGGISLNTQVLDFGGALEEQTLQISNTGSTSREVAFSFDMDWLQVSDASVSLDVDQSSSVTFNVDRGSVAIGSYEGKVSISMEEIATTVLIVKMQKLDPNAPLLTLGATTLDFGETLSTEDLTLTNEGMSTLNWSLISSNTWVSASTASGTLYADQSTSISITVSRDGLTSGDYTANLSFDGNGGTATVAVSMTISDADNPDGDDDNDGIINLIDADDDNNGLIEIFTINDLNDVRNDLDASGEGMEGAPSGGFIGYELMNDLDFEADASYSDTSLKPDVTSGTGWEPIGLNVSGAFNAVFEGNGYTIGNLYMNRTSSYTAFFESTGFLAEIRNLNIDVRFLSGTSFTAGLVGSNEADISGCSVTGVISESDSYSGLFVGRHIQGTISDSYAEGSVTSSGYNTGGFIGETDGATGDEWEMIRCYANVNVTSGDQTSGGFIGDIGGGGSGSLSSCYATGNITANDTWAGGFAGQFGDNFSIVNCYATGTVTSTGTNVGGFIGRNYGGSINSCYSTSAVVGSSSVGGFMGSGSIIASDNYWDTETSGVDTSSGGTGQTTVQLQGPTSNTGIYITWSSSVWDFGTTSQYPVLKDMPNGIETQRD